MADEELKTDKDLKEILRRMGLMMISMKSSVKKIERIQTLFLRFFLLEFVVSFILGFILFLYLIPLIF